MLLHAYKVSINVNAKLKLCHWVKDKALIISGKEISHNSFYHKFMDCSGFGTKSCALMDKETDIRLCVLATKFSLPMTDL